MNSCQPISHCLKSWCGSVWRAWVEFWFAPRDLFSLGVFRAFYGFVLVIMYSIRQSDWKFLFTDAGMVKASFAGQMMPEFYRPAWQWFPTSPGLALAAHIVFLLALLMLTLGIAARPMAMLAAFLHLGFMQRNMAVIYGADIVNCFWLFYLSLSDSGQEFSLMSRFRKPRPVVAGGANQMLSAVGMRLIQIQLCLIYGYTGLEKLKGVPWWNGSAIWDVFGNQQLMMFEVSFMQHLPLLIAAMTFTTLLFEIYFPVLVWIPRLRPWILSFGVAMHLGIGLFMGLYFFSLCMVAAYIIFIDSSWLRTLFAKLASSRAIRSAMRMPSQAAEVIPPA